MHVFLIQNGASAKYVNTVTKTTPLHSAAEDGNFHNISLLLKYPENKVGILKNIITYL